jgi:hypothetical protein
MGALLGIEMSSLGGIHLTAQRIHGEGAVHRIAVNEHPIGDAIARDGNSITHVKAMNIHGRVVQNAPKRGAPVNGIGQPDMFDRVALNQAHFDSRVGLRGSRMLKAVDERCKVLTRRGYRIAHTRVIGLDRDDVGLPCAMLDASTIACDASEQEEVSPNHFL